VARIEERLGRAVAAGELAAGTDIAGLTRFVVAAQAGMSFLARDGAGAAELEAVAAWAMRAWPSAIG
jgi:hypothetical protein